MNAKQRNLTWAALATFSATLIFSPWIRKSSWEFAPIWDPPFGATIALGLLFAQWVAIGIAFAGLYFLFGRKPNPHQEGADVEGRPAGKRNFLLENLKAYPVIWAAVLVITSASLVGLDFRRFVRENTSPPRRSEPNVLVQTYRANNPQGHLSDDDITRMYAREYGVDQLKNFPDFVEDYERLLNAAFPPTFDSFLGRSFNIFETIGGVLGVFLTMGFLTAIPAVVGKLRGAPLNHEQFLATCMVCWALVILSQFVARW